MNENITPPEEAEVAMQEEAAAEAASGGDAVVVVDEGGGGEESDKSQKSGADQVLADQQMEEEESQASDPLEAVRREPEIQALLGSESEADLQEELGQMINSGAITQEEGNRAQAALQRAMQTADMTIDNLIKWNKGSNLDTFLEFLANPTGVSGRNGEPLRFGSMEGFDGAEKVPLHVFRALLAQPTLVGSVLRDVAVAVDADWVFTNSETFSNLNTDSSSAEILSALVKIHTELLNNNQNQDELRRKFRVEFASKLRRKDAQNEPQVMDDSSFTYLFEQLDNNGEKLSQLWGISE